MDNSKIAKAITYLRKTKKYTQKDLAEKLGISDKAVSKWERGLGIPDVSLLARLSIILDTDIESLLEGNVSHHKQNWVGLLIIDEQLEQTNNQTRVYAGTLVYDKPLVYYLLSYYMLVGIKEIMIICNHYSKAFIDYDLEYGKSLGISIACVDRAKKPDDILIKDVIEFIANRQVAVINGYHFLYGIDLTKFMQRAMTNTGNASILAIPNRINSFSQSIIYDSNRKVIHHGCKLQEEQLECYYTVPFIFCSSEALKMVGFEHVMSYDALLGMLEERGLLYTELMGRGMFSIDVNSVQDVLMLSEFINIIQKTQNINVACLEEIAWRRGLIIKSR